jgi:hypothetical protein
MGGLPQVFNGDRARADDFIEEVKGYLRLNQDVAGYNSPIKKVVFTLTLIKGLEVAGWTCDIGAWIDTMDPVADNLPEVWDTFLVEFATQFQDSSREEWARIDLENCCMCYPYIDEYISKFEGLAHIAGYTQGSTELMLPPTTKGGKIPMLCIEGSQGTSCHSPSHCSQLPIVPVVTVTTIVLVSIVT